MIDFFIFFICLYGLIITHEMGHCWYLNRRSLLPEVVVIGLGPHLCSLSIRNRYIRIHIFPLLGYVKIPYRYIKAMNLRQKIIFYLSGSLFNAFIFLCCQMFAIVLLMSIFHERSIAMDVYFDYVSVKLLILSEKESIFFSDLLLKGLPSDGIMNASDRLILSKYFIWVGLLQGIYACMNLIPLPYLDGGYIVSTLYQFCVLKINALINRLFSE